MPLAPSPSLGGEFLWVKDPETKKGEERLWRVPVVAV